MTSTTFDVHEDWATPAFDFDAVAACTGPFVRRRVLAAWHRHRGTSGKVLLVEGKDAFLPLYADGSTLGFLGEGDLTDYHTPLGTSDGVRELTAAFIGDVSPGTVIRFDSLPSEAADPLEAGLADAGIVTTRRQHEVAAVLTLPTSFDDWLAAIGKKERHEVRRKRRRFEDDHGSPHLTRMDGPDAVRLFVDMHRAAAGDKGTFMTPEVGDLFADLTQTAGALIDVLTTHDGDPVAAAFGFEDDDGYYLYNSAYDPAARQSSPGIVMLASLIERAISAGKPVFDFLKGDEPYKFRHGAAPRPLFALAGTVEA